MSSKTKVVLDTDAGTDDAWALITLLKCESVCNIELKAVTVVSGNTWSNPHGCQNILLLLKALDRLDVPVYCGAENSLIINPSFKPYFHGTDGLMDVIAPEEKPSLDLIRSQHAVEALRSLIEENPNEILICAIGPLTNIALLYKLYPQISQKIKGLYIMGGNFRGQGNTTKAAEFNFWFDPEAAQIVLHESRCPIYVLPWETCLYASLEKPFKEWRFNVLNAVKNEIVQLMDKVEIDIDFRKTYACCDCYLIVCLLFPKSIKEIKEHHATVERSGEFSRGAMILDHRKENKPNAFVIEEIDVDIFEKVLMFACGHDIDVLKLL